MLTMSTTTDPGVLAVCEGGHFSMAYKTEMVGSTVKSVCIAYGCCHKIQFVSTAIAQVLYDRGRVSVHERLKEFVDSCRAEMELNEKT